MYLKALSVVLLASGSLTACANFKPPAIDYDNDPAPAVLAGEPPLPVKVVALPKLLPHGISQGEMPPLFVLGPEGGAELVNYRARQNYYIVDRLFAAAELRLGGDKQQKVRIVRT